MGRVENENRWHLGKHFSYEHYKGAMMTDRQTNTDIL